MNIMEADYICSNFCRMAAESKFPIADYEKEFKKGNYNDNYFESRDYIVRDAKLEDMEYLLKIEEDCWAEKTRADRYELEKRIESKACKNFALEYRGEVVGVLYTQRLHNGDIKKVKSSELEKYRCDDGDFVQLITLNVRLNYQDRGWGGELLEFALEYFSIHPEIKHVGAVTRCRDFLKSNEKTLQSYMQSIYKNGRYEDPTLLFHQSHGAKVLGLVKNYRPHDLENQGFGVLIQYNIKERPWLGAKKKSDGPVKENAAKLLVEYITNKLGIKVTNENLTLHELGLDSLDFTELFAYVQQELSLDVSVRQLNSKTLKEILDICNEKEYSSREESVLPLQKRIRGIMKKYEEVVPLALEGEGPITFWIHPLSGDVGIYNDIASQSDGSFRMIAIKAQGFLSESKQPLQSVTEIAKYYCEIITSIQPEGEYHLCGFSFGGTIAYEVAYQLEQRNKQVDTLLMVEAPYIDGQASDLFETDERNNLLMNANFLLLTLSNEQQGISISKDEVASIGTSQLLDYIAGYCKEKGLKQTKEELKFKIYSMSKVHEANLRAIRGYQAKPLLRKDKIRAFLFHTKEANAISKTLWNPDYLENIQREKGSLLPLMEQWKEEFPSLKTIILEGDNHFDIFHEKRYIETFYKHCKKIFTSQEEKEARAANNGIAVIGISGRFPDADNVNAFWDNLKAGRNSIKEYPNNRGCDINDFYDERQKTPGKTYVKKGGFLSEVDKFDSLFFKIAPKEAQYMDPSERIFMEETWKAIEDAGYNPTKLSGQSWGVFCCAKGDYEEKVVMPNMDAYYNPTNSYASSRISYYLNLTGPAIFMDTACSSTLSVIAQACDNLVLGNCEVAIAGGGGIYSTPSMMVGSSQSLLFSPDETCYTFDKRANGTVIGEGIGAVILKPLDKAVEDNDRIYGVIRGWGMNQDGKTNGITAPSKTAQEKLQKSVYEKFDINPENITMIEAHGTGTKLGDAVEFQALTDTFRSYTKKINYCSLCSYKPNLGHAFFGSGVVGLIKVLLSIKNKQIPPMLNFEKPNENIDMEHSPFYVTTKLKDWEKLENKPRCAAINSFGATGTNVHLVVEEYTSAEEKKAKVSPSGTGKELFVLSAREDTTLEMYLQEFVDAIEKGYIKDTDLGNLAYTLTNCREHMKYRFAVVAESVNDLAAKLRSYLEQSNDTANCVYTTKDSSQIDVATITQELVNQAIEDWKNKRDANLLARLFVGGHFTEWERIYNINEYSSISIPTYPFAKNRIWIENKKTLPASKEKQTNRKEELESVYLFSEQWMPKEFSAKYNNEKKVIVCFVSNLDNERVMKEQISILNPNAVTIFVAEGNAYRRENEKSFTICKNSKHMYQQLFAELKEENATIDNVIYMWPYESSVSEQDYVSIIYLIQAMIAAKTNTKKLIIAGQYCNGLERCYLESFIGFERSLGNMIFRTLVNTVLFEVAESKKILSSSNAQKLLSEMNDEKASKSVIYTLDKKYQLEIKPHNKPKKDISIKQNGTYIITGGLGKLGYLFAMKLAKKYGANLVLTGRGVVDDAKREKVSRLEQLGGKAIYICADVCIREQMEKVVKAAKEQFHTIDGVLYMAGTANEKNISSKDAEFFMDTIEPKVKGIQILDDVLGDSVKDFVCYFSSLAAVLGDFGVCDYSIGNRFEMAYAQWKNQLYMEGKLHRKTLSICWPLWRDGGMKLSGDSNDAYLEASGQRYLESEEGFAMFEEMLNVSSKQYFIMTGNKEKIYESLRLQNGMEEKEKMSYEVEANVIKTNSAKTKDRTAEAIADIKKIVSKMQGIQVSQVNEDSYLADYGYDSISYFDFARDISELFDIEVTVSGIIGYQTIKELVQYLLRDFPSAIESKYSKSEETVDEPQEEKIQKEEKIQQESVKEYSNVSEIGYKQGEPIAIIGISGKFPGADSVEELWQKLLNKEECLVDVTERQWESEELEVLKNCSCKKGGFVNGIDEFDPMFFQISPNDARQMDPCQRLFLQESWHALEDAGYMGERIKGKECGVFVGAEESQYGFMARKAGNLCIDQNALLSSRIAYALDLTGPNMSITASCSSGLVALHQACLSLRNGDCEMALAGGVSLLTSSVFYEGLDQMQVLSADGKSYIFDDRANGMVPAEGVAAVVLKPLSKAVEDGDHIYGCIKGSGVNYNGRGLGMMSPNPKRESELMNKVLKKCNVSPKDIQYVMTHSVGIKLGDNCEVEALKQVFRNSSENDRTCYLGTVKPITGHTFAASGFVNLFSLLMSLKHNTILGVHNYEEEHSSVSLKNMPFRIPTDKLTWERRGSQPRIGTISTFANSGTNAFAVIEEYISNEDKAVYTGNEEEQHIFVFSATDKEQLYESLKQVYNYLTIEEDVRLNDVAYTLQVGRTALPHRLAILAASRLELLDKMLVLISKHEIDQTDEVLDHVYIGQEVNSNNNSNNASQRYEQQLLKQFVQNRDLEMVCMYWIRGNDLDWNVLYDDKTKGRIVSLPGYPFKKERYWYLDKNENKMCTEEKTSLLPNLKTECSEIKDYVVTIVASYLGIEKDKFDCDVNIQDYGADSILLRKLVRTLEKKFDCVLASKILLNHPTVNSLSAYLEQQFGKEMQGKTQKVEIDSTSQQERVIREIQQFRNGEITIEELKNTVGEIMKC